MFVKVVCNISAVLTQVTSFKNICKASETVVWLHRVVCSTTSCFLFFLQVATGQPHEGSTYSARKDCQMALNRAEYAKVKLGELGRTCEATLEQQQTWTQWRRTLQCPSLSTHQFESTGGTRTWTDQIWNTAFFFF